MRAILYLLLASTLAVGPAGAMARDGVPTNWHNVASDADRDRLRNIRQAWTDALAKARGAGNTKAIAAQGVLFDPDVALDNAKPPAGDYHCRVFKLGAKGAGNSDFVAYPTFRCRVAIDGALPRLSKLAGSQRPTGQLFDDGRYRQIFLGTLELGDERSALEYGRDAGRDMAGTVERIGPRRWRLTLPYPHFESVLDVIELVPAR
ncbi:DUF4893 domain-containing protein [Sphingomonas bacterium]|uniref:DUF4893 domain-containing protein n=1 Tax=Sphingomonas bacterium TaxID=1895847 RepID=UPI002629D765|nr:DUF4893 domain-containing protein [Sphingomonas bacterium]MDB5678967.1 hypothetical protein [Sphingomonas bacterium]